MAAVVVAWKPVVKEMSHGTRAQFLRSVLLAGRITGFLGHFPVAKLGFARYPQTFESHNPRGIFPFQMSVLHAIRAPTHLAEG
ncbi:hypothetical protein E2562_003638 [Oryza meyeriana var. granulata]|uniref:Uncharacterized protein n=1 Tax=Oryza meyeriana var. granulata TaxID=110450 RepID=A0A6G1C5C4_9ORYZ|nr:hypothetical protein E2562_003638 [Oryza meyeriana var. granulata]